MIAFLIPAFERTRHLSRSGLRILLQIWPVYMVVLGTGCAYFGWILDHPAQHGWTLAAFGSAEAQLLATYERLRAMGTIGEADPGFQHIALVLLRDVSLQEENPLWPWAPLRYNAADLFKEGRLRIREISVTNVAVALGEYQGTVGRVMLEVQLSLTYRGEESTTKRVTIPDIRQSLLDEFVEPRIYSWSHAFFMLGLALTGLFSMIGAVRTGTRSLPH